MSKREYRILEAVREESERFDASVPIGFVIGNLAKKELKQNLNVAVQGVTN